MNTSEFLEIEHNYPDFKFKVSPHGFWEDCFELEFSKEDEFHILILEDDKNIETIKKAVEYWTKYINDILSRKNV